MFLLFLSSFRRGNQASGIQLLGEQLFVLFFGCLDQVIELNSGKAFDYLELVVYSVLERFWQ